MSWAIRPIQSLNEFLNHMSYLTQDAVDQGAEIVVLPESIDLERLSYIGRVEQSDVARVLVPDFDSVFRHAGELARHHKITLVAGSHLRESKGRRLNSAIIANPEGIMLQDKNVLTQWEAEEWKIDEGRGLVMAGDPPLGVTICYDCEFPQSVRALCERGARLLVVPAYNELERGFNRVRRSIYARLIENQIYGIHSALVGGLGYEPVAMTYGRSAIMTPLVEPFPAHGIVAETPLNIESVAVADIDLDLIDQIRERDDVRNWHDRNRGHWEVEAKELVTLEPNEDSG